MNELTVTTGPVLGEDIVEILDYLEPCIINKPLSTVVAAGLSLAISAQDPDMTAENFHKCMFVASDAIANFIRSTYANADVINLAPSSNSIN